MLEVAMFLGLIDLVLLLGDYVDFYCVSQYGKDPRVGTLLMDEVLSVREGLDELDRLFPQAKKVYLEGNHEWRLERYLVSRAPELFGITECRFLFELNRRPLWSYIPFGRSQQFDIFDTGLLAFHRPKASAPKIHIQRTGVSSIYGDIHKIERAHTVSLDGKHLTALCPGWLGDVSSRVFDYMPATPQWQLGFAIVFLDTSSNEFHVEQFEIKNHATILNGKKIQC